MIFRICEGKDSANQKYYKKETCLFLRLKRKGCNLSDCIPSLYFLSGNLCFCIFGRNNRNESSVFFTYFELYSSVYQGEKSVVFTHTDVVTRMEFSTSLTNDDVTCLASFATKYLNA